MDSRAYFQDDMAWCVKRAKYRSIWRQVFAPVDFMVLLCIFAVALPLIWITFGFAGFQRRPFDIWTSAFLIARTISGTASNLIPEKTSLKIFYMLYLHLGFIVTNVFVSDLFAIITLRFQGNRITSFDEIVRENFRLAAEQDTMNSLLDRNMVNDTIFQTLIRH